MAFTSFARSAAERPPEDVTDGGGAEGEPLVTDAGIVLADGAAPDGDGVTGKPDVVVVVAADFGLCCAAKRAMTSSAATSCFFASAASGELSDLMIATFVAR